MNKTALWRILADRQRSMTDGMIACGLCELQWPIYLEHNLQIDRIKPGVKGGQYEPDNTHLVCPADNALKGNKWMDQHRDGTPVSVEDNLYRVRREIRQQKEKRSGKQPDLAAAMSHPFS